MPGRITLGGGAATLPTKRVTHAISSPTTFTAPAVVTAWAERIPIKLPVKTKRWRMKVANWYLQANADPAFGTTPYNILDIYMGAPAAALSPIGRLTGAFSANATKVLDGGAIPVDGTDWVSGWVTDPNFQLGPDTMILVWALNSPSGGNGSALASHHSGFRNSNAGANTSYATAASTGYFGNTQLLDKRIEYEVDGDYPVGFFIGASGEAGYNLVPGQGGGYEPVLAHETPPGAWGMKNKALWINGGIPGGRQLPWAKITNWTYQRFDLTTTKPDFVYINLAGNSILNGATAAATEAEVATVVNQIRAQGMKRIYLTTIVPIGEATNATALETARTAYNSWVRNNPLDVSGVIDVDLILRDPANNLQQLPGFVDADKIHCTLPGYQRWGQNINIAR